MFLAAFNRKPDALDFRGQAEAIKNRLTPFVRPDRWGQLVRKNFLMVQSVVWNTSVSRLEKPPHYHPSANFFIVSWARLDNREEIASATGLPHTCLNETCNSTLIAHAFYQWGEDCISHLEGDFVFAVYQPDKQRFFCGRDHMGVRPFYYCLSDKAFVCATNLPSLTHFKGVSSSVDERWMASYLLGMSKSFDKSPYKNIQKLPPAHSLSVTAKTHQLNRYFNPNDVHPISLKDSREYVEIYRKQLNRSVRTRLDSSHPIGSELSGGLDSSTVTALAAGGLKENIKNFHAFSIARNQLEPQLIMTVSQALGLPQNHILSGRNQCIQYLKKRSLKILGYPMEHGTSVNHDSIYKLAQMLGVQILLSGFGGDEFSSTLYGHLVPLSLSAQGKYVTLYKILEGNFFLRFLKTLKLYFRKNKLNGLSQNFSNKLYLAYKKRWKYQIVNQNIVNDYDLKNRYLDLAQFDTGYTDLKKFILERIWQPNIPTRMENCQLMASARRVEYRWPLLDIRLVKLFLAIPSEENFYRGIGRYLHRRAINGVLPNSITWKKGKWVGSSIASKATMQERLKETIDNTIEFIQDPHPDLLGLVDMDKLRSQISVILADSSAASRKDLFLFRQNMAAISYLNTWLTQESHSRDEEL